MLVAVAAFAILLWLYFEKTGVNLTKSKFNVIPFVDVVSSYTLEYSEGDCNSNKDCEWAGDACGGGHGLCTNNPSRFEGSGSICDINQKFPANNGYMCSCVKSVNKCGWVK